MTQLSKPVLLLDSPEAASAATPLLGEKYDIQYYGEGIATDFRDFYSRVVLIWPKATDAHRITATAIAERLSVHCEQVRVINTDDAGEGYDATQFQGTYDELIAWAKPRVTIITPSVIINPPIDEDPPLTQSAAALVASLGLAVNDSNKPILNIQNVTRILERADDFKLNIWFDEFHERIFTTWNGPIRAWRDTDTLELTLAIQNTYGLSRISDDLVFKAVCIHAEHNRRNEPRDWMDSLVWDSKPRISNFFTDCMGADSGAYSFAVSHNFWVGMVARIYRPGCQMDNMVVLEGAQGIGKSRSLRAIGESWYAQVGENIMNKDFYLTLSGKMLIELAEMDSVSKAEVTAIKRVISTPSDNYRVPYGRTSADHHRTCVFVGSTNESHYLRDSTGARRFWPIKCGSIDFERMKRERNQLFAEAVACFKSGAEWWLLPEQETKDAQESRRQRDDWEDEIAIYLNAHKFEELRSADVATALKITTDKLDQRVSNRIARIMKSLGWVNKATRRDGVGLRVWSNSSISLEKTVAYSVAENEPIN